MESYLPFLHRLYRCTFYGPIFIAYKGLNAFYGYHSTVTANYKNNSKNYYYCSAISYGARAGTRTWDLQIRSHMLCHLSHGNSAGLLCCHYLFSKSQLSQFLGIGAKLDSLRVLQKKVLFTLSFKQDWLRQVARTPAMVAEWFKSSTMFKHS